MFKLKNNNNIYTFAFETWNNFLDLGYYINLCPVNDCSSKTNPCIFTRRNQGLISRRHDYSSLKTAI
jgi:hypothetical protein